MGLIEFILLISLLGVIVYAIVTYVPMPQPFKLLIVTVAVIVVVLWLVRALGLDIAIPRVR